jgi:hypothetical protein
MYLNLVPDDSGDFVKIETKTKDAVRLFHDVNRMLSLLDLHVPDLGSRANSTAESDQNAYNRVNEVLAFLQRELNIDPDVTEEL